MPDISPVAEHIGDKRRGAAALVDGLPLSALFLAGAARS
jgi:hypothetical protein